MSKTAMPKSKAKTAYGLLSEIRRLILEEPKRYDQGTTLEATEMALAMREVVPECGTVGCVAGWVVVLKTDYRGMGGVCTRAAGVLGLSLRDSSELFDATAAGYVYQGQTQDHATRGAAHIARFQKKYAAQLKAKRV